MAAPDFRIMDSGFIITYTPAISSGVIGMTNYVTAALALLFGHPRVYNRQRHTRNRGEFETLFVDAGGLDFWTVRRTGSLFERISNNDGMLYSHTLQVEGIIAHKDTDDDATGPETVLQNLAEDVADEFRGDITLGGLGEYLEIPNSVVVDEQFAGVACHVARVDLKVQEFVST